MRRKVIWITSVSAVIALLLVGFFLIRMPRSAHATAANETITARTVPNPFGGQYTNASAINNAGMLVGSAVTSDGAWEAIYWDTTTPGAQPQPLQSLSPTSPYTIANDINATNAIIGYSDGQLVEWPTPTSAPTPLRLPDNTNGAFAGGINDAGQIVGTVSDMNGAQFPVAWLNSSSAPIRLTMPNGATGCQAADINKGGEIVASCDFSSSPSPAGVYWARPDASVVPIILSPLVPGGGAGASAINNLGHIVGISAISAIQGHATMWLTPTSSPLDLGPALPPTQRCSDCGIANAVNNLDQAVGQAATVGPALFESGAVVGLPTPSDCPGSGWGFGINDVGQAVGGMSSCGLAILWENIGPPPTPQEQLAAISTQVQGLVSANALNAGEGQALEASLNAASASIGQGNANAACQQTQAFVNKVQADVHSGKLTPAQGQALLNAANPLIGKFCN